MYSHEELSCVYALYLLTGKSLELEDFHLNDKGGGGESTVVTVVSKLNDEAANTESVDDMSVCLGEYYYLIDYCNGHS